MATWDGEASSSARAPSARPHLLSMSSEWWGGKDTGLHGCGAWEKGRPCGWCWVVERDLNGDDAENESGNG